MVQDFFYCSELSRSSPERAFGTASTGEVWLLVEYTQPWGVRALEDSDLSVDIKNYLNQLVRRIPRTRLLFIKQERRHERRFNLFVARAREREPFIVKFCLDHYEQLKNIYLDVATVAGGQRPASGTMVTEPLYLVCTHGKRDKCCAKFGYPLYKSLRAECGDLVWQSSHVGGDRFAANLICFPHALFYAHMTVDSARHAINKYDDGQIVLEKFRGRACFGYPVQAAEFFIRSEAGITGVDDLRHLSSERASATTWRVRFVTPDEKSIHEALVTSRASSFQHYITCAATGEKSVTQFFLDDYRALAAQ